MDCHPGGKKFLGIIGHPLIYLCNWEIDYETHSIRMTDRKVKKPRKAIDLVFDDKTYNPMIEAVSGSGKKWQLIIDYGSQGGIDAPMEATENFAAVTELQSRSSVNVEYAVDTAQFFKCSNFTIGGKNLGDAWMLASQTEAPKLGGKFLSQFRVTIDYKNKHAYFVPHRPQKTWAREPSFCIAFSRTKNQFIVRNHDVCDDTLTKYQITVGDTLETVNGLRADGFADACMSESWYEQIMKKDELIITTRRHPSPIRLKRFRGIPGMK